MKRERDGQLDLTEFLEQEVFPPLDRAAVFKDLEPADKGFYYLVRCPACGKREAYVYKTGYVLKCNRLSKCGHTNSLLAFVNGGTPPQEGYQLVEAVRRLSGLAGITFPEWELSDEEKERVRRREARCSILESVVAYGQRCLWSARGETARHYLRNDRGFTDDESQALGLGLYSSATEVKEFLHAKGHGARDIEDTGVVWPQLEGYILLPWTDEHGRPLTLHARWHEKSPPEGKPKTLALPGGDATRAFPLCFNLALRAGHKDIVLVSGPFVAFMLQARGDTRVVASGSPQVSEAQVEVFARHKVRAVTICVDADDVGDRGIVASIDNLTDAGIAAYVAPTIPNGVEADEFVRKNGIDAWRQHVSKAVSGTVYRGLQYLGNVTPTSGDAERRVAVEKVLDYHAMLRGEWVTLDREDLLRLAAERTGYTLQALSDLAEDHAVRRRLDHILRDAQVARADPKADARELARSLAANLSALQARVDQPAVFSVDRLDRESAEAPAGRLSGWKALDLLDVRFNPGELTLLAARTGHGKTSTLVGLLLHWLRDAEKNRKDEIFIFYSEEESEIRLYHRLLAILSLEAGDGWSVNEVRDYLRNPTSRGPSYGWPDLKTLQAARDRLRSWESRLEFVYRPNWSIHEIEAHARDIKERRHVGAVFVDFLQRVPLMANGVRGGMDVAEVARRLKYLSGELAAPMIAGSQISQDATPKDLKAKIGRVERYRDSLNMIRAARPDLHSLKEDGSEPEADLVLGLLNYAADYRGEAEKPQEIPDTTLLEVGVLKNPAGAVGSWAPLYYVGRYGVIRDASYPGEA